MKPGSKYLLAAALGALSTVPAEIVSKILVALGVGQYAVYELNSLLVLSDKPDFFMGMFVNFVVGGFAAALLCLALEKMLGTSLIVLKSILISWLIWFVYELLFTAIIEGNTIPVRPLIDHVVHIIAATVFGCTLGIFLKVFIFKRQKNPKNI